MLPALNRRRHNLRRFFVGEGPKTPPYYLHQRRVYILPTRQGMVFAMLLFAMLLGSINYNNNLGYILTFLLAGLSVVSIFLTYRNLLHLSIGPAITVPVFAGRDSSIAINIDNRKYASRKAIEYHFPKMQAEISDLAGNSISTIHLPVRYTHRGMQPLHRFIIATSFPLGFFRAWSHVELEQKILVYPQPGKDKILPQLTAGYKQGDMLRGQGDEDFEGLKNYQPGDSFSRVHWKSAARHNVLQIKQYMDGTSNELWIKWDDSFYSDIEKRLSQLTQWVLLADRAGIAFGFRIPGIEYAISTGMQHRNNCLKALALYGSKNA